MNGLKRWHHEGRYRIVREWVRPYGPRLLDIGCGAPSRGMKAGGFLDALGYGTGMDVTPQRMARPFVTGSITDIPFPDQTFDVVTAMEVIEHVRDASKAFREMHRVLRDNGVLVFTTPDNHLFFRAAWAVWSRTFGRQWLGAHVNSHPRNYWRRAITQERLFSIKRMRRYWGINAMFLCVKESGTHG